MPPTEATCPAGTIVGDSSGRIRQFHSIRYSRFAGAFDDPGRREQGLLIDATTPQPGTPSLSITTPSQVKSYADLPVMVWIHGGRFEEGDHTDDFSQPGPIAKDGFVHVRVGYRLKFPGLMPFPGDAPGHYRAVADCAEALAWIQRNIEGFGGDPTNVTIVGQSAGAALVLWLCRRDHYRGEFRRALAMSPAFPRHGFESRKWAARGAVGKPLTRGSMNELFASDRGKVDRAYRRFRNQYITDMALGPYPLDPSEMAEVPLVLTCTDNEFYATGAPYDRLGPGFASAVVRGYGPRMDLRRDAASEYISAVRELDPHHVAGRFMSDSLCRRFVDMVAEGAPGPVWLAEHVGGVRHSADLTPMFASEWLREYLRTGEVGWPAYEPVGAGNAGGDETAAAGGRVAARRTLAGETELVTDPLGYLRGAFTYAGDAAGGAGGAGGAAAGAPGAG